MNNHQQTETEQLLAISGPARGDPAVLWAGLDRAALRKQFAAGELPELEFEAIVFRAEYPNWNFVRFRDEELDALAQSFVGAPFLRNHDMQDIAARDGIVTACWMEGPGGPGGSGNRAMHAKIKLTTQEGMRDFLAGRIDRFSISWFGRGAAHCSVCGREWSRGGCTHTPGQVYAGAEGRKIVCELIHLQPVGREISAVNVPASSGTQVLEELLAKYSGKPVSPAKEQSIMESMVNNPARPQSMSVTSSGLTAP